VSTKLNVDRLQEGLRTEKFGRSIVFLRETNSTNDLAKDLAGYGAAEGTVVVAETQKAGRGRLGREWLSPRGGLWFSVVLRPELRAAEMVKLVFVAGLAVADVLRELYRLRVETKWPNDVLVNGLKVCGILAEMKTVGEKINYVVVGVGVNTNFDVKKVFPEQLRVRTSSLENELGRKVKSEELLRALLEKLEELYELFLAEGFGPILKKWKNYASFLGCQVELSSAGEKCVGVALDVDSDSSLVMQLEHGALKHVFAGDVFLRSR
jgi:BirA family biotin operon repressor/biotin-[acetyl-CoA-carboxylase] ligase